MKRTFDYSGYATQRYTLELEGWEMYASDAWLIYRADNSFYTDEAWAEVHAGAHPGHFGGRVERPSDSNEVAFVTVYID